MIQRSLYLKLTLLLLVVSVLGLLIVSMLSRGLTVRVFENTLLRESRQEFEATLREYYQAQGSWDNAVHDFVLRPPAPPLLPPSSLPNARRERNPNRPRLPQQPPSRLTPTVSPLGAEPPPPPSDPPPLPSDPPPEDETPPLRPFNPFALANQEGRIVIPAGRWHLGDRPHRRDLARGDAFTIKGEQVGTILLSTDRRAFRENLGAFRQAVSRNLLISGALALLIALSVGMLFARSLVRPLRQMSAATRKLIAGEYQQVPVDSKDELGQLAENFNQMMAGLELAEKNRQQMTADIAHELRTPLTGLAWHLEAFQAGALEANPEDFALMQGQVQHLQHLVEDLRVLSLADAGKFSINSEMHDPNSLLAEIVRHYQPLAEDKNISLKLDNPPTLAALPLDYARMMQVMHNLLSNALRFTPEGGSVTITARERKDRLELAVSDTGKGIPADTLPHIFERFYQGDSARQQQAESSSGLGLAIVKAIVEAHRGEVAIVSALGQGTTVTVSLLHASPLP